MPASPTRLRLLLLVLAALTIVFVVRNLPEPEDPPAADFGMEELRRALPEVFEPLDRLRSEEVLQALSEDPVAFVARQIQQQDTIEVQVGLLAMKQVSRQRGQPEIFRSLLPRVLELARHDSVLVRSCIPSTLAHFRSFEADAFWGTTLDLLRDPAPPVRMAAAGCLSVEGDRERDLEGALLEAAEDEPRPPVKAFMLDSAGRLGGERAAAALLVVLADASDAYDPHSERIMLASLGRCGQGIERARELLLREAFSTDTEDDVVAGAREGLFHLLTQAELADLGADRIATLRAAALTSSAATLPTALLLGRVARAREDAELAGLAARVLAGDIRHPWGSDSLTVVRELLALADLTDLDRDRIASCITEVLDDPYGFLPFEYRRELRAIRDSLR